MVYPIVRSFSYIVEVFFALLVLFGPWAFGTTQPWSVWTLCIGTTIFFLMSSFLLLMDRYFCKRFDIEDYLSQKCWWTWVDWVFVGLSFLPLLYIFIQWWNACSYSTPGDMYDLNDLEYIEALPTSFDKPYTAYYLVIYFTLFLGYLGVRFLAHVKSRMQQSLLEHFLWIALASAFVMVIVGSLMRLDKTKTILWLVEREHFGGINNSFGPYGYRSSAAQYMNLLWPLGIAMWWNVCSQIQKITRTHGHRILFIRSFFNKYILMAVMGVFVFAGVWIAISRGGVWIGSAAGVCLVLFIFFDAICSPKRNLFLVAGIVLFLLGSVGLGLSVAGDSAARLMDQTSEDRIHLYESAMPIHKDYPLYGTGAGTYPTMILQYVEKISGASFSLHSDWLQMLIELGYVGSALVVLLLLWALLLPWITGRGSAFLRIAFILALSIDLVHAAVDLPFYVMSVCWLFVTIVALYHSEQRGADSVVSNSDLYFHH